MENYTKPIPRVTEETKPYWAGCRKHKLLIQRCKACGKFQFYPRALCSHCLSELLEWVEAKGTGTIYSFSNVYRPPLKEFKDLPYVVAIIELDEGVRMMSNVVGINPEKVRTGGRVKVVFEDITEDLSLPKFTPCE